MSDVRMWMGVCALVTMLACTVGEVPPQPPSTDPGGEPVVGAPGVPEDPAADTMAADAGAALLARSQQAYDAGEPTEALRLSLQLLAARAGTAVEEPARWVAARAAFALGRYEEAQDHARRYASAQPAGSTRRDEATALADLAADALAPPSEVATVGVVLPRTGPRVLVRYADWLLEGMELAVAEAERRQNRRIRLVVADDAGGARVREATRELERQGVVAILGPMLPEQIMAAAGARTNPRLVLVSPTSTEAPGSTEAYSINSSDASGAQELGRYAGDLGLRRAAVLYPRLPEFERKARAFAAEFEATGGQIRAMVPYDSGTTTFGTHLRRIMAAVGPDGSTADRRDRAQPFALFVAAPARDVPQIAPQVAFYGLDEAGVQLFGDEAWASAAVRRVVPSRDLEGVLAASRFPPDRANAAADPDFVDAYEARYRRSLDNELPALGYDAAHLVVQALPNRLLSADAFARRFHLLAGIRGATGMLSVRANQVVRAPYLVMIQGGQLTPAPQPQDYDLPSAAAPAAEGLPPGARR